MIKIGNNTIYVNKEPYGEVEDSKLYCINSPGIQDIEMNTDDISTLPHHTPYLPPTCQPLIPATCDIAVAVKKVTQNP